MDSFPQKKEEDSTYNGWLTWLNYSDMPDYEEKVNEAISMLIIFDVDEPEKNYICWYHTMTYNEWLVLDIKNKTVYFRNYTY